MASSYLTLTDLAKINDASVAELEITDLLNDAPVLAHLAAAESSNGQTHKYNKETGAPVVGFRSVNAGRDQSKSADTQVTVNLALLDGAFTVDAALADIYRKGRAAYVARELKRHLKAMFASGESAIFNGVAGSVFDGLLQAMNDISPAKDYIVDAGGADANACTSIYLIRTNGDGTDCTVIGAGDGNEGDSIKIHVGETVEQRVDDGTGKFYTGLCTDVHAWLGLQIGSALSVVRVCNIAAGTTVDDDLFFDALERFPEARQPNLIVCNKNVLGRLRKSRTATNATGAPAPLPTEVAGIPIITTASIASTEAVVA